MNFNFVNGYESIIHVRHLNPLTSHWSGAGDESVELIKGSGMESTDAGVTGQT